MKISGVDIRPGNIIEYEGGIWRAVKIQETSRICHRLHEPETTWRSSVRTGASRAIDR